MSATAIVISRTGKEHPASAKYHRDSQNSAIGNGKQYSSSATESETFNHIGLAVNSSVVTGSMPGSGTRCLK
jgi:hypothetical protein